MKPAVPRSAMTVLEAVSRAPLFKGLPEDVVRECAAVARPVNLRKGQRLFSRGDPGHTMFIIVKGLIEISLTSGDGRKISLNVMEPGTCFGEISMLDGHPRSADAMAGAATSLLSIPRDGFLAVARRHSELALSLTRALSDRVRWISDSVEEFALLSIDRRLARRLLILFDRFADDQGALAISQGDLADFAGATRETTNRVLSSWRKRGWLAMGRKKITLLERDSLDSFAMNRE